jgi:uncharacterized protein involved in exopolysaccharide biosynthesis
MADEAQSPRVGAQPVALPRGYFIALPSEEGDAPGLLEEAVRALIGSWVAVAACAISFAALGFAAAEFIAPVYRSETLLAQPAESQVSSTLTSLLGQLPLPALAGLDRGAGGEQVEALAILKSRAFAQAFIQDENLLPVLFADKWDAERGEWRVDSPADVPTLEDAYQLFDEKVCTITEDGSTGLVTLSIQWSDRLEAARWANALVHRVNDRLRQRAIAEAEKSIEYLNDELEATSIVELRQSIYRLVEEQLSRVVAAKTREEYAFRQIDPAVVADEDSYVWPNRLLMVAVGFAAGLFIGVSYAFLRQARRDARGGRVERPPSR